MVSYERDGPVAVVSIDRPDARNAVDDATARGLRDAWRRFEDDDEALVGVLTGDGDTFSAGADLKKMDLQEREEGWLGFTRMDVSKPTIAAVEGYCVAGGLEMALWADLRIAGESATFGCFERRFGVPLVDGGTQRLPRLIGQGRALEMILTGDPIDAETALDWGLVNRVVDEGDALAAAVELGKSIAAHPQRTVRTDRAAVYDGLGKPLSEGLRIEARHGRRALDVAEDGAARFAGGEGRGGEAVDGIDDLTPEEPNGDGRTADEANGDGGTTDEPNDDERTTDERNGDEGTTGEPNDDERTADEANGGGGTTDEPNDDERTTDERNGGGETTDETNGRR